MIYRLLIILILTMPSYVMADDAQPKYYRIQKKEAVTAPKILKEEIIVKPVAKPANIEEHDNKKVTPHSNYYRTSK